MKPNSAQLVAALCLAFIAFIVSGQVMPLMPEGTAFGYFTVVNMVIGLFCGWIIMGKRTGRGRTAAINNGLTGAAAMVFWALFVQGAYEMVDKAMHNRYGGPFEALAAIFVIGMNYGKIVLTSPSILFTLLVGGVLAGLAADYAKKRWN